MPHLFIPKQLLLLTGALSITATPTSDIPHILPHTKHIKLPRGNTEEVTHIYTDPALKCTLHCRRAGDMNTQNGKQTGLKDKGGQV